MSGFYDLYETPCPASKKQERETVLHARPVGSKTYTLEDAVRQISQKCTLTPGDVKAALVELTDYIATNLREGNRVQLDGLGNFSISLKCKPATDRKEVRSQDVHFNRIHFQSAVSLNKRLQTMKLYRLPDSMQKIQSTREERLEVLLQKLETEPFVTTRMYRRMTGLSDYAVKKDLTAFAEEGILVCNASRHAKFYYKKGTVI